MNTRSGNIAAGLVIGLGVLMAGIGILWLAPAFFK